MNKIFLEIRSGEGGLDSKDLVRVQTSIYNKLASRNSL